LKAAPLLLCAAPLRRLEHGLEPAHSPAFGIAVQRHHMSSVVELAKPLTHPDVEGRKDLALFAELALAF